MPHSRAPATASSAARFIATGPGAACASTIAIAARGRSTVGSASGHGLALVEQLQVARHPGHPVRVDAAQVGPDQRVGHRRGVGRADAARGEDARDQAAQVLRA